MQDALTWILGEHSLKSGVKYTRNRKDQNGRSTYLGDVAFNNQGNPNTTNNPFADALLGNFRTYTEASNDPLGFGQLAGQVRLSAWKPACATSTRRRSTASRTTS